MDISRIRNAAPGSSTHLLVEKTAYKLSLDGEYDTRLNWASAEDMVADYTRRHALDDDSKIDFHVRKLASIHGFDPEDRNDSFAKVADFVYRDAEAHVLDKTRMRAWSFDPVVVTG